MTSDLSERAKLVTVLCSILHLRGDDIKTITDKWAVKPGGIVGWLQNRRPQQGDFFIIFFVFFVIFCLLLVLLFICLIFVCFYNF